MITFCKSTQKKLIELIQFIFGFFQTSKMPMYQTMWEFMSNHRSEVMVGSNTEGIAKVIKDNGKYAYMMESSSIQYIIERNCKVTQIGGNLDTKVKGIHIYYSMSVRLWNFKDGGS